MAPSARTGTAPQSAGWSSNSRCAADQINLAADPCFIMNVGHRNSKMIVKSLGIIQGWDRRLFELVFAGKKFFLAEEEKNLFEQKLETKWTCLDI